MPVILQHPLPAAISQVYGERNVSSLTGCGISLGIVLHTMGASHTEAPNVYRATQTHSRSGHLQHRDTNVTFKGGGLPSAHRLNLCFTHPHVCRRNNGADSKTVSFIFIGVQSHSL